MTLQWKPLQAVQQLEEIKAESFAHPVAIFKHSTTCNISQMVLSRWDRQAQAVKETPLTAYYLDLKAHRDVSNAIAQIFEVEHESPQVLLIRNGQAVLSRSHYDIRLDDVLAEAKN